MLRRVLAAAVLVAPLLCGPATAVATPFADVPASSWAYADVESLAADGIVVGYPDGTFKGDRPLTRYEMAAVVARALTHVRAIPKGEPGPSRADLEKLQKLVDAYKDELDALGVRETDVEDRLDRLERATAVSRAVTIHGVFLPQLSSRQQTVASQAVGPAGGRIDPIVATYLATDPSNDPLTAAGAGLDLRQTSRFVLGYAIDEKLSVSLPVRFFASGAGGPTATNADVEPSVEFDVTQAGALHDIALRFGIVDDLLATTTGLAFRTPESAGAADRYALPFAPLQRGLSLRGTVAEGTFGLTDVQASFTQLDDALLDAEPSVLGATGSAQYGTVGELLPSVPAAAGLGRIGVTPRADTFASGPTPLGIAYLSQAAVAGSVAIATYQGPGAMPAFAYDPARNAVVFATPLPAGAQIVVSYDPAATVASVPRRYLAHVRAVQHVAALPGFAVGVSASHLFDVDGAAGGGIGAAALPSGYGLVDDTVLGLDLSARVPIVGLAAARRPVVFGELASTRYSPDSRSVAAVGAGAGVIGVRATVGALALSVRYQSVGAAFAPGAPVAFAGTVPAADAGIVGFALPGFFGIANTVAIDREYDGQFAAAGLASPGTAANPALAYGYPVVDPFEASGPAYFSAFAPNSAGPSASFDAPVRVFGTDVEVRGGYRRLGQVALPSAGLAFGPAVAVTAPLVEQRADLATSFAIPVARNHALATDLQATYAALDRADRTAVGFTPIDAATGAFDAAANAAAASLLPRGGPYGPGSAVSSHPNYVAMRRIALSAAVALPLTRELTLGGFYSTQAFGGTAGTTLGQSIAQTKVTYQGSLTYAVPRTNSSLTFVSRHDAYRDRVLPSYDTAANRQDLDLTVRF